MERFQVPSCYLEYDFCHFYTLRDFGYQTLTSSDMTTPTQLFAIVLSIDHRTNTAAVIHNTFESLARFKPRHWSEPPPVQTGWKGGSDRGRFKPGRGGGLNRGGGFRPGVAV